MLPNFIRDENPFNLAPPPKWFLKQLMEFDPSLVIVPSRQGFYYRLAQRRKLQLTEQVVNEALFAQSDTKMLASHSLVPVTTILANPNWGNPILFQELRDRCPHMNGGAEKVIKAIEDREFEAHLKKLAETDENLTYLSKDAWKYYNIKIGTRTGMYSPKVTRDPYKSEPVSQGLILPNSPKEYKPIVTTGFVT